MNKNIFTKVAKRFLLLNGYYQLHKDAHVSYSQMGEDLIISQLFEGKKRGFYVDVGAFHPILYSNTFRLYQEGWRGINIDANPGSMQLFNKMRPKDINLEIAIARKRGDMKYFQSNAPALNTLSPKRAEDIRKMKHYTVTNEVTIPAFPLSDILAKHVPKNKKINLLNVDVEGMDLEVLKSNDWKRFRPEVIIAESFDFNIENPNKDPLYTYLRNKKYKLEGKTNVSLIFKSAV